MLIRAKKIFSPKIQYGYQKTQNFTLISNPLKKIWKNAPKKVISKNVTEICTFLTFTHVSQTCFAYNFFWCIFSNLFQRIRNQREILRFLIPILNFCKKIFFYVIFVLFSNFEAKRAKNGSKNQKTYLVNVSYISILHPSKGLYSSFSKKKSNSLYPTAQLWYHEVISAKHYSFWTKYFLLFSFFLVKKVSFLSYFENKYVQ